MKLSRRRFLALSAAASDYNNDDRLDLLFVNGALLQNPMPV
jgi:hypothetical protein